MQSLNSAKSGAEELVQIYIKKKVENGNPRTRPQQRPSDTNSESSTTPRLEEEKKEAERVEAEGHLIAERC